MCYVRNLEIHGYSLPDYWLCDSMLLYLCILQKDHCMCNSSVWQLFFILVRTVHWRTRSSPYSGNCSPTRLQKDSSVDFVSVELYLSVYKHTVFKLPSQIVSVIAGSFWSSKFHHYKSLRIQMVKKGPITLSQVVSAYLISSLSLSLLYSSHWTT